MFNGDHSVPEVASPVDSSPCQPLERSSAVVWDVTPDEAGVSFLYLQNVTLNRHKIHKGKVLIVTKIYQLIKGHLQFPHLRKLMIRKK